MHRGGYHSVDDPRDAIYNCLRQQDAKQKPFAWSRTAEDIPERAGRALAALDGSRENR